MTTVVDQTKTPDTGAMHATVDETTIDRPRTITRRRALIGTVTLAALSATVLGVSAAASSSDSVTDAADTAANVEGSAPSQPTERIIRRSLVAQRDAVGTVDYGDSWELPIKALGVVTSSPEVGTIVRPGEQLIRIGDKPVFLAKGSVPLYRELSYQSKRLVGEDVAQLQRFLIAAGFDQDGKLEVDGDFGRVTQKAVKAWQKANGLAETGAVDRTQLLFSPRPLRIEQAPRVGDDFSSLTVTDAEPRITASLSSKDQGFARVGAEAKIVDGSGATLNGRVTKGALVADEAGSTQWNVSIEPIGDLDASTSKVSLTFEQTEATDVLTVPVRAIVALAGGGTAVEVVTPSGPELRRVELGANVDDLVEVSGDIAEGDEVIVPSLLGGES